MYVPRKSLRWLTIIFKQVLKFLYSFFCFTDSIYDAYFDQGRVQSGTHTHMTTGFSPPTDSLHGLASSLNPIVLVIGLFPALVIYRVSETGFLLFPADIK
jgi:hypothetical protein